MPVRLEYKFFSQKLFNYSPGYDKTVRHIVIGIYTVKGARQLKLHPSVNETLQNEKVEIVDVINIEASSEAVESMFKQHHFFNTKLFFQRQARCDTYAIEYDLETEEYVPLPIGNVHKKKEVVQDVTLHDPDETNARPQVWTRYFTNHRFINQTKKN